METDQSKSMQKMQGALWIAGLTFGAIIIAALILFILPSPPPTSVVDEVATTTEAVLSDAETVATPAPTAPPSASQYPPPGARIMQNGVYVTIIHFNGTSFTPSALTISRGEEVRFINTSNLTMDVGSQNPNASSPAYAQINQPMAKGKGGVYQLSFTEVGVWAYANQTGSTPIKGTISVK